MNILKDKIPTKVKVEVWMEIDHDIFFEKLDEGIKPSRLLNEAAAKLVVRLPYPSGNIFQDYDRPVITAIKYEDDTNGTKS